MWKVFRQNFVAVVIGILVGIASSVIYDKYIRNLRILEDPYIARMDGVLDQCSWVPPDSTLVVVIPVKLKQGTATPKDLEGMIGEGAAITTNYGLRDGIRKGTYEPFVEPYAVAVGDKKSGAILKSGMMRGISSFYLRMDDAPDPSHLGVVVLTSDEMNKGITRDMHGNFEAYWRRCTVMNLVFLAPKLRMPNK